LLDFLDLVATSLEVPARSRLRHRLASRALELGENLFSYKDI